MNEWTKELNQVMGDPCLSQYLLSLGPGGPTDLACIFKCNTSFGLSVHLTHHSGESAHIIESHPAQSPTDDTSHCRAQCCHFQRRLVNLSDMASRQPSHLKWGVTGLINLVSLPSSLPPPHLVRIPECSQGFSRSHITPGLARHTLVLGTSSHLSRSSMGKACGSFLQSPTCLAHAAWGWVQVNDAHLLGTYLYGPYTDPGSFSMTIWLSLSWDSISFPSSIDNVPKSF